MGGIDSTGKPGAGGEFAKQAVQWLTPNVPNGGRSVLIELVQSKGTTADGEKRTVGLESQTKHWATPRTVTGGGESAERKKELGRENSGGVDLQAQVAQWPSPRASDGPKGGPNQRGSKGDRMLPSAAANWPTPAARDWRGGGGQATMRQDGKSRLDMLDWRAEAFSPPALTTSDGPESSSDGPGSRRRLNPAFGCWLMGWPCWWTNPAITSSVKSEMALYRFALRQQLSCLVDAPESSQWKEAA